MPFYKILNHLNLFALYSYRHLKKEKQKQQSFLELSLRQQLGKMKYDLVNRKTKC